MATKLMYGPDDRVINRAALAQVPTPAPMGTFHHPYPFARYVEDVEEALDIYNLEIVQEEFCVTSDKQQFFGMLEITGRDLPTVADWKINVGLRGSHNQTLPRGLVLGTQVMVCSNLCFHGNIGHFATKQTTEIANRLPWLIREALIKVPDMAAEQAEIFDNMKQRELKRTSGDAALVEMYRQHAFSSPQLTTAINEWDKPSFDHGDELTIWRLFNAGTQALKPGGENVNMATVERRSRVVSDYCTALAA